MGCSDAVDKAAKRRIFSPEDPPKAVTSASERLPPENVADDSTVARRVLGMGAAEITERVGPHRYSAKVSFDWTGAGRGTRLEETRTLFAGPGGVAGDFHATIENSRDQGLEVMRVRGQVYARSRYGRFRQRLRDRGMAEREREEVQGAVRDFDSLFLGRLKLSAQGSAGHEGRTVWKYVVSLGPPGAGSPPKLPPLIEPKGGQDETTKRRRAFLEQRQPRTLEGEVLVDAETSVVLKAHLVGRLSVEADAGVAELRMVVDCSLTEVGREAALAPPKEFLPDEDKPQGIADALDRFGIPRVRSDAGTGAEEVRPDDE
ncbi:MAG: hypothetical protein HYZ28_06345 [Myxococcales bacterium]|nr:hypothetical protein [Myxococcales bacterium]